MAKETIRNAFVFRPVLTNTGAVVPVAKLEGKVTPSQAADLSIEELGTGRATRHGAALRRD
jgi:hypothetical protein